MTPLASPHSRITPACAGKSRFSIEDNGKDEGSPPRVRGKDIDYEHGFDYYRITPACAGKSSTDNPGPSSQWDHPRVCGEKLGKMGVLGQPKRITPACAGKR